MLVPPPKSSADEELEVPRVYIERVVFAHPAAAAAAFDDLVGSSMRGTTGFGAYRSFTRYGDLVLHGPVRTPPMRRSAVYPIRVVAGRLSTRSRIYRMHVQVELLRWSPRASALGLFPISHRNPLGFGPYFRIGCESMTHLRDAIEAWAHSDTRCA